jgi:hypothetical protein
LEIAEKYFEAILSWDGVFDFDQEDKGFFSDVQICGLEKQVVYQRRKAHRIFPILEGTMQLIWKAVCYSEWKKQ